MGATEVLIVGAGPTGLVLALWLTRMGIRVRVVDKAVEPGTTSRALAVHARTLELYAQLGIADAVVERGLTFAAANLWVRGEKAARIPFGEFGKGLSAFPYILIYPQDEHERTLIEHLALANVRVERRTELLGFEDRNEMVSARLRLPDGTHETCEAAYLAGCDGAHSVVREQLNVGFAGGTYEHLFYVADVEAQGAIDDREFHANLDESDLLLAFPMKGEHRTRLIGTVRQGEGQSAELSWKDVDPSLLSRMHIDVQRVNWFSTYRVHHRLAGLFRSGHVFLLGDAAHIHSPVGGQGMNTGIGDAVNLAWKLAAILRTRAHARLLDTYEPERIAFARRLVATTDRAFVVVTSSGRVARFVRVDLVPRVLPLVLRFAWVKRVMFRTISQIAVNYRQSKLSVGRAGGVRGGDRLPWSASAASGPLQNFAPLRALDWQVHVYGEPAAELTEMCRKRALPLHAYGWQPAMRTAGLKRDASYLVRPDGYVAAAGETPAALERYLNEWAVKPPQIG